MTSPRPVESALTFVLDWPPRGTSQNDRMNHFAKAAVTRVYRAASCTLAIKAKRAAQRRGVVFPLQPRVEARVVFVANTERRRDLENFRARLKAAWDGIVDAGVLRDDDQKNFRVVDAEIVVEPKSKACVRVALYEGLPS